MPIGCGQAFCEQQLLTFHSGAVSFQGWIFSHLSLSHLMSSHLISCLLSLSRLFSADRSCSHLFSCHLGFLIFSAHLNSSLFSSPQLLHSTCLSQLSSSQRFAALLMSGRLNSCHLISACLTSSSSSHVLSSLLSSLHISTLPQLFHLLS